MVASPERPLLVALAIDLACAWAGDGASRVIATHPPHPLLPLPERVTWLTAKSLAETLERLPADAGPTLALISPDCSADRLARLEQAGTTGLLLPIDAGPNGIARALGLLRRLASVGERMRVCALALGAAPGTDAAAQLRAFESASRRQLGIAVEPLGAIERDREAYRSLLEGVASPAALHSAEYVRRLREVSERL